MGHGKLRKFAENETFACLVQPSTQEVLGVDHPLKGHWAADFFHNDNPIVLELGCGKGEYTIDLARRNPSINYIGVDIKGARLWKGAKQATQEQMGNVGFLRTRIEFISSLFAPGEISGVWITFADPQIGRENKRLTSPRFLDRYRGFMKEGGIINLKTDSRYLHEYSRAIAEHNDLKILAATTDLYNTAPAALQAHLSAEEVSSLFEVQTFYERHFLAQGYPITYLSFVIDHEGAYESPSWDEEAWKGEDHHAFIVKIQ